VDVDEMFEAPRKLFGVISYHIISYHISYNICQISYIICIHMSYTPLVGHMRGNLPSGSQTRNHHVWQENHIETYGNGGKIKLPD
jgi:hypothetical protein